MQLIQHDPHQAAMHYRKVFDFFIWERFLGLVLGE
jgi:hypothetical protein